MPISSGCLTIALTLPALWLTGCYRPSVAVRTARVNPALGQLAYEALSKHTGTVLIVDPKTGRVLNRVGHSADVQFESPIFELAQIVTAYTALATGVITEKTLLPCDAGSQPVGVVEALARGCPLFFRSLSEKISLEGFSKSAEILGFVYYGIETSGDVGRIVRPIVARLPAKTQPDEFAELATAGQAMLARDLHFANLVTTLASGSTAAERFANFITTTARAPAPPAEGLNPSALRVIREGLIRAVDSGELAGAATFSGVVAAKGGGERGRTILISYAPATSPEVCLVIHLEDGGQRAAADVAGRFYQAYFKGK